MLHSNIKQGTTKLDSISLDKRIILCAYIRSNANESLSHFLPLGIENQAIRLSPSAGFSCNLINRLCLNDIIKPDYYNLPNSSVCLTNNCYAKCEIGHTTYLPNVTNLDDRIISLKELAICIEDNLIPRTDNDLNDLGKLWKELALYESLEYLQYVLSERSFPFKPGEKTIAILNKVLTKFSTSQAYYFIYAATKNASDFYQSKNVSMSHAANTIPEKIRSLFDRAVSENWEIAKYSRNHKKCPPSALNNILYDKLIGFTGFDDVPDSVLLPLKNSEK